MYQSRCQSRRNWYAPIRNEPEPHAGSRIVSFATSLGVFPFTGSPTVLLHDIFHDVLWGVEDPARLLHFRLLLHLRLVPVREPDHLAEELLVHLAEDLGGMTENSYGFPGSRAALMMSFSTLSSMASGGRRYLASRPSASPSRSGRDRSCTVRLPPEDLAEPGVDLVAFEKSFEGRLASIPRSSQIRRKMSRSMVLEQRCSVLDREIVFRRAKFLARASRHCSISVRISSSHRPFPSSLSGMRRTGQRILSGCSPGRRARRYIPIWPDNRGR